MKFREEVLRAANELELRARKNLSSLLSGNYRSAFRGSGMQFKEFRHYEPGDDIRHMSWPVTARTGKPTVKVFEEERELDVLVMADVSGSSLFGNRSRRKIDMYGELMAMIGLAAIRAGDNVGFLLFNDTPAYFLPPRRSRNHLLVGITHLLSQPLNGKQSDLRTSLAFAREVLRNKTLILVLSDFFVPPFDAELVSLSQRHEILLMHCYDDTERGMGLKNLHEVQDPETGEFYVLDGNSKELRNQLAVNHVQLREHLESIGSASRTDYLSLSVEDDYLQRLVQFFRRRGPARL